MTISDDGLITWIPESVGDYGPVTVSVLMEVKMARYQEQNCLQYQLCIITM